MMRGITLAAALALCAPAAAELDSDHEKLSYAIGLQIAQSLLRQGVEVDLQSFTLAIEDAVNGVRPRLSPEEMSRVLDLQRRQAAENLRETARRNLQQGKAFLAENARRENVKVLESGLQYRVVRMGDGPRPKAGDTVRVHYTGTLVDGREFDSSHRRGEPAVLPLDGVIEGWKQALPLMPVGSKWELYVPPDLAYGARGAGATIGPNETLVFEIELLGIEKPTP